MNGLELYIYTGLSLGYESIQFIANQEICSGIIAVFSYVVSLTLFSILRVMDELQAGMALDGTIFSLELTTLDLSVKIVSEDERATGVSFTSRPASKQVRV